MAWQNPVGGFRSLDSLLAGSVKYAVVTLSQSQITQMTFSESDNVAYIYSKIIWIYK